MMILFTFKAEHMKYNMHQIQFHLISKFQYKIMNVL